MRTDRTNLHTTKKICAMLAVAGALAAFGGCEEESEDVYEDAAMADGPAINEARTPPLPDEDIDVDLGVQEGLEAVDEEPDLDDVAVAGVDVLPARGITLGGMEAQLVVTPGPIDEVRVGEPFRYTMTVRNTGDNPVHGVHLRPVSTSNVRLASNDGEQQNQQKQGQAGGMDALQVGTLAPGESKEIAVRMVPQQEGPIRACLAVDYDRVVCATAEAVAPQLRVMREAPQQAFICEDLTLTYVVVNTGSGETEPVTLREQLPEGLTTADGARVVELEVGAIGAGEEIREQVPLRAARGGVFEGSVVARTASLTAESDVQEFRVLDPRLDVKVTGPSEEYLDRPITYRVQVSNVSEDPAPETIVTMPVPDAAERPTFAGDVRAEGGAFLLGTLEAGETREFSVTFTGVEPGTLQATATAEAYCAEAVSDKIATNVKGIAALRVEAVDLIDPVPVGEETVYVVQLKNQGTAKSINVRATADVPDGMEFVSAEGASQVTNDGGTLTFEPIPELAPNDVVEWRITCLANEAGKRRFKLNVQSDATKKQITELEPTNVY